jgi:hypothetical protein
VGNNLVGVVVLSLGLIGAVGYPQLVQHEGEDRGDHEVADERDEPGVDLDCGVWEGFPVQDR